MYTRYGTLPECNTNIECVQLGGIRSTRVELEKNSTRVELKFSSACTLLIYKHIPACYNN